MDVAPTAAGLSYGPLVRIFLHLAWYGKVEGGERADWLNHHHLAPLAIVCRTWTQPTQAVLFESVSIRGERQARFFLRTLSERPSLAYTVRSMVIGLEAEAEDSDDDVGQARESMVVVQALVACLGVRHLQVRPLHASVRATLITTITSRRLETLVLAPRVLNGSTWSRGMWHPSDHRHLLLPTLSQLEIDHWTDMPGRLAQPTPGLPTTVVIPLTVLRVASDMPSDILSAILIGASATLVDVDVYGENRQDSATLADALRHCAPRLTSLRFISNPTLDWIRARRGHVPLFDRILPQFSVLTTLSISATDVSTNLFGLLPACVQEVEIQSLSEAALFFFEQRLVDDLSNRRRCISLRLLTVKDVFDTWTEEEVDALGAACAARGIEFDFIPDSESSSE